MTKIKITPSPGTRYIYFLSVIGLAHNQLWANVIHLMLITALFTFHQKVTRRLIIRLGP